MNQLAETDQWFLITDGTLRPGTIKTLADHWKANGLGQVMVLTDGLLPVRVTPNGLETPHRTVHLTDDQFDKLLDALDTEG